MRASTSTASVNRADFVLPTASSREQLRPRTKAFALRIVALAESLPHTRTGNHFANQLLRCGTSVGANYRAACRARSSAEFCAKLGIVEEEADEAIFWMELIVDAQIIKRNRLVPLLNEANELLAMIVSSIRTARRKK